ncbi:MAG: divalent-cation tolerance protein CutA [Haloarculaceae archaeon]
MPTVYVTAPREAAPDIADTVIEERLAACVNRVDCESTYRWDGEVHHDPEAILLIKTAPGRCDDVVDRIEAIHPHDVPAIERFAEADVLDRFATWRDGAVE